MRCWSVELEGQRQDLEGLAATWVDSYARVVQIDDQFVLESEQFEQAEDAAEVLRRARTLVRRINGLAKVDSTIVQSVRAGLVRLLEEQGKPPKLFNIAQGALVLAGLRISATGTVTRPDGTIEESAPAEALMTARLKLAAASCDVARAIDLFGEGDRDFRELYKVLDIIELAESTRAGSKRREQALLATGWTTHAELERFTRTAQPYRHGTSYQPHPNPMTLDEGRNFIRILLSRWLASL
jgi:hypothetical protein